jgi:outer membrane protein TolC
MHRKPLFLLLTILLVSCASAPPKRDLDTGVTLPVRQQASQTVAEIDSAWWMEFVDSQLNQILGEAFAKNYDLTIAAANLQAAAAQARIAGAPLYPQANLSFNGLRAKQNFIGFPLPGAGGAVVSTTTNSFGVAMNVSWELDLWGRLRADKAGALAQLQASHADFIGARLSLAAQVSKTWFAAIEAKRQMELSQATVDNWRLSHERVQRRYESGLTTAWISVPDFRRSHKKFRRDCRPIWSAVVRIWPLPSAVWPRLMPAYRAPKERCCPGSA